MNTQHLNNMRDLYNGELEAFTPDMQAKAMAFAAFGVDMTTRKDIKAAHEALDEALDFLAKCQEQSKQIASEWEVIGTASGVDESVKQPPIDTFLAQLAERKSTQTTDEAVKLILADTKAEPSSQTWVYAQRAIAQTQRAVNTANELAKLDPPLVRRLIPARNKGKEIAASLMYTSVLDIDKGTMTFLTQSDKEAIHSAYVTAAHIVTLAYLNSKYK